jgi:hypothetical protein
VASIEFLFEIDPISQIVPVDRPIELSGQSEFTSLDFFSVYLASLELRTVRRPPFRLAEHSGDAQVFDCVEDCRLRDDLVGEGLVEVEEIHAGTGDHPICVELDEGL